MSHYPKTSGSAGYCSTHVVRGPKNRGCNYVHTAPFYHDGRLLPEVPL